MEYTSKDRGFYTTMLGTSVYPKNTKTKQSENFRTAVPTVKKASSFLEDYEERVKSKQQELAKPLKIDLPSEQSGKSASEGIKKRISTVLSKKYGELDTKHLFDDIDDSEIEKNIPLARNTVETSLERGTIKNEFLEKLPNLVDGLALSFAAAEKGNNKAATRAREAAYMEGKETPVKVLEDKLKKQAQPKNQNHSTQKDYVDLNKTFEMKAYNADAKSKREKEAKGVRFREEKKTTTMTETLHENNKSVNFKKDLPEIKSNPLFSYSSSVAAELSKQNDVKKTQFFAPSTVDSSPNTLYYGNIWNGEPEEDLFYSDLNYDQLVSLKWISWYDVQASNEILESEFRNLANTTSFANRTMKKITSDMIDHFIEGSGTDYKNIELNKVIGAHEETQRYMKDFSKVLDEYLDIHCGNLANIRKTDDFRNTLKKRGVLISTYDYFSPLDVVSGFTFAIHGWTESKVDVTSFVISPDGKYKGTLMFTFKDNFGLDKNDIGKFGYLAGFRSWFVMQHYYSNFGKYKPFKTIVEIEYPISGKIEGYRNEKNN